MKLFSRKAKPVQSNSRKAWDIEAGRIEASRKHIVDISRRFDHSAQCYQHTDALLKVNGLQANTKKGKDDSTMSELRIITNGHRRPILYWHELTDKERKGFDWIDDTEVWESFFRYKGWTYCLADFTAIRNHPEPSFSNWDGYSSDSFFSGIVVKYPREEWGDIDTESVIVGWYYC